MAAGRQDGVLQWGRRSLLQGRRPASARDALALAFSGAFLYARASNPRSAPSSATPSACTPANPPSTAPARGTAPRPGSARPTTIDTKARSSTTSGPNARGSSPAHTTSSASPLRSSFRRWASTREPTPSSKSYPCPTTPSSQRATACRSRARSSTTSWASGCVVRCFRFLCARRAAAGRDDVLQKQEQLQERHRHTLQRGERLRRPDPRRAVGRAGGAGAGPARGRRVARRGRNVIRSRRRVRRVLRRCSPGVFVAGPAAGRPWTCQRLPVSARSAVPRGAAYPRRLSRPPRTHAVRPTRAVAPVSTTASILGPSDPLGSE